MRRYLNLLVIVVVQVFADESGDYFSNFHSINSGIVAGHVNVVTGDFIDHEVDIVIAAPDPFRLVRSYASSHMDRIDGNGGWTWNHPPKLFQYKWCKNAQRLKYEDENNFSFLGGNGNAFVASEKNPRKPPERTERAKVWSIASLQGVTNASSDSISSKNNIKNSRIWIEKKRAKVTEGSGDKYYFDGGHEMNDPTMNKRDVKGQLCVDWFRPCGVRYHYEQDPSEFTVRELNKPLRKIEQIGVTGKGYGWIKRIEAWKEYNCPRETFLASNGTKITYKYHWHHNYNSSYYITEVISNRKPTITYGYVVPGGCSLPRLNLRCEGKVGRDLHISYYDFTDANPHRRIKVRELKAPVHSDNKTVIATHTFDYPNDKTCKVTDARGHVTCYFTNNNKRLKEIQHFNKDKMYVKEMYAWGTENMHNESNLMYKLVHGEGGKHLYLMRYEYDDLGNILEESIAGDLTGNREIVDEIYKVNYEYYSDACNNQKSINYNNGLKIEKEYWPGSNLVTAIYTFNNEKLFKREFKRYHPDSNVLIEEVEDDGVTKDQADLSGVTRRNITTYKIRDEEPVGLPEEIKCCVLNVQTGEQEQIKRIERSYLLTGEMVTESTYDADDQLQYTLHNEYDSHGNLVKHTNALGQVINKGYDSVDRLIVEEHPYKGLRYEYDYDRVDRLIRKSEVWDTGDRFEISFEYDFMGNKISETNAMGQTTYFEYDDFGRLIKTTLPQVETGECPVIGMEYNELGYPTKVTDPNGNSVITSYNLRGKPVEIIKPDGSVERFFYSLDGKLIKSISATGIVTHISYDPIGRVICQEEILPSGQSLGKTIKEYDAYHLLKTVLPDGLTTTFDYNSRGQLINECCGNKIKSFTYDSSGRVQSISDGNLIKYTTYDSVGRIIEERSENNLGKIENHIRYGYDDAGNQNRVYSYINGEAIIYTQFNQRGQPLVVIDCEGNETRFKYDYNKLNGLNQRVLEVSSFDPMGYQEVTQFDSRGKPVLILKKNSFGDFTAKQEIFYDLAGRAIKQNHYVISEGELQRIITHNITLDKMGRPATIIEASGTPEQKITQYRYNYKGQKIETLKNDGVSLFSQYDEKGLLVRLYSSDGSVDYSYTYNASLLPILIVDNLLSREHKLYYNEYRELIKEELGHGLPISYDLDDLGRILKVTLPDQSSFDYTYEGSRIRTLSRNDFIHKYVDYNFDSNPLESTLASGQKLTIDYDKKGRVKEINGPHLSENNFVFNSNGQLIGHTLQGTPISYRYDSLKQLTSDLNHTYKNDSLNNRICKDQTSYSLNSLNQILEQGETRYNYDRCGNLTEKRVGSNITNYYYDALDRLTKIDVNGSITEFTFDSLNRRLTKNDQKFIYQGQNEIGSFINNSLSELRLLGCGRGAEIGAAVLLELDGTPYIPLHDHNGNVVTLLDINGNLSASYQYSAFGEEELPTNHPNPWHFASKRLDSETHLLFFGRRCYDPSIGKWITPDPIGYDDGPNLYAYLHNSPLLSSDLYGLADQSEKSSFWSSIKDCITSACDSLKSLCSSVRSGCSRAADSLSEGFRRTARTITSSIRTFGRVGEQVVHHLVPHIPIAKDAMKMPFHFLQHGTIGNYEPTWKETHSGWYYIEGEKYDTIANVIVNGIFTSKDEAIQRGIQAAGLMGKECYVFYVASHGFVSDLLGSIFDFLGIPTHASSLLDKGLTGLGQSVGSTGTVMIAGFSRGCATTTNALTHIQSHSQHLTSRYNATLNASPVIPKPSFDYSYRVFMSSRDGVTKIDLVGHLYQKIQRDERVNYIKGEGFPFIDHTFDNSVYGRTYNQYFINYTKDLMKGNS